MIIAETIGAEILSVDSMQVYRGMDIGTAKPSPDDRRRVQHHMIDVAEPSEQYSVAEFKQAAEHHLDEAAAPVLIVGGSGLHFRSLVDPLDFPPTDAEVRRRLEGRTADQLRWSLLSADPSAGEHVDLENRRRVLRSVEILELTGRTPTERADSPEGRAVREYRARRPVVAVGVDPGSRLAGRVSRRFDEMLDEGLVSEVERLQDVWGPTASQAVGYREIARVVAGEWDMDEGRARAIDATTSLARRQRTYFRRDPRISWLEWEDDPALLAASARERFEEAGWSS